MENSNSSTSSAQFYIEAAINEEGPKRLRVVPSDDHFIIYHNDDYLCKIKKHVDKDNSDTDNYGDAEEWHVVDGDISRGIARVIGKAINLAR